MPKGFLTPNQVLELRQEHRRERDKKLADRIKAVLSLNSGYEYSQVAQILLLDEVTLRRYVKEYQERGIEGLLEMRYRGGKTTLILSQEIELKEYLKENTKRTAKEIVAYVLTLIRLNFLSLA